MCEILICHFFPLTILFTYNDRSFILRAWILRYRSQEAIKITGPNPLRKVHTCFFESIFVTLYELEVIAIFYNNDCHYCIYIRYDYLSLLWNNMQRNTNILWKISILSVFAKRTMKMQTRIILTGYFMIMIFNNFGMSIKVSSKIDLDSNENKETLDNPTFTILNSQKSANPPESILRASNPSTLIWRQGNEFVKEARKSRIYTWHVSNRYYKKIIM